jgi:hypothetical protein
MFFHPDPRDRDGLLGYAYSENKQDELKEITGLVGKGLSIRERKLLERGNTPGGLRPFIRVPDFDHNLVNLAHKKQLISTNEIAQTTIAHLPLCSDRTVTT